MASPWPQYPAEVQGGDDPTFSPAKSKETTLAAERGTQHAKRVETDSAGNVYVNVAAGSLTPAGTQDVNIAEDSVGLAKEATLTDGSQKTQVTNFPATQPVTGPLTDAQLRATPVPVSGAVSVSNFPGTQAVTESNVDKNFGTWSYYAGISGTVTVTAGQRVIGISAHSTAGGTMTINGGATITIPANVSFNLAPLGNVVAPTIVFTGTDTYFIEVVA